MRAAMLRKLLFDNLKRNLASFLRETAWSIALLGFGTISRGWLCTSSTAQSKCENNPSSTRYHFSKISESAHTVPTRIIKRDCRLWEQSGTLCFCSLVSFPKSFPFDYNNVQKDYPPISLRVQEIGFYRGKQFKRQKVFCNVLSLIAIIHL